MGVHPEFLSIVERGSSAMVNVDNWKKAYAFYTAQGVKSLPADQDPIQTMPDPMAMRKELAEMKNTTKASFREIAASLGVSAFSINNFMRGNSLRIPALYAVRDGLAKLKGKPAQLAREGIIKEKQVKASKPQSEKSLIEAAPPIGTTGISAYQLDMMELQVIHRLRGHMLTEPQKPLNGRQRH